MSVYTRVAIIASMLSATIQFKFLEVIYRLVEKNLRRETNFSVFLISISPWMWKTES